MYNTNYYIYNKYINTSHDKYLVLKIKDAETLKVSWECTSKTTKFSMKFSTKQSRKQIAFFDVSMAEYSSNVQRCLDSAGGIIRNSVVHSREDAFPCPACISKYFTRRSKGSGQAYFGPAWRV